MKTCHKFLSLLSIAVVIALGYALPTRAQEYQLSDGVQKSTATLAGDKLVVESNGKTFVYTRHTNADSATGSHLGFYCADVGEYIRWPANGKGHLYMPDGGKWVQAKMQITAVARGKASSATKTKTSSKTIAGIWIAKAADGSKTKLFVSTDGTYSFEEYDEFDDRTDQESGRWVLTESKTDPRDFTFSVKTTDGFKNRFSGKWNADFSRFRLTNSAGKKYTYQRIVGGSAVKGWLGKPGKGWLVNPRRVQRRVRSFVPNPALSQAKVVLKNSHSEDLVVLIAAHLPAGARGNPNEKCRQITIAPNGTQTIEFTRDAGGVVVVNDAITGVVISKTPVLPKPLYDIVVYENRIQSVYVDGTKSPPTREVRRGLKSVGVYTLPPGNLVKGGDSIGIYKSAARAKNPGAVARYAKPD